MYQGQNFLAVKAAQTPSTTDSLRRRFLLSEEKLLHGFS